MTLSGALDATTTEDGVQFRFAVTNTGDDAVELTFPDGMDADLAVFASEDVATGTDGERPGDPDWRWSDDRLFTQAIRHETLQPGETLTTEFEWPDPGSGTHTGVATLEAQARDCEAHATVSV